MHQAVQAVQSDVHNQALPVVNKLVMTMVATPRAGFGEVVVHMQCRPVQPVDLLCVPGFTHHGSLPATQPHWALKAWAPSTRESIYKRNKRPSQVKLCIKLGDGVEEEYGLKERQRVFPYIPRPDLTGQGSWQEFVLVPAHDVFPIPDCMSDHVASQFYVNPWTALAMLWELNPQKGDYIIQTAAASTVDRMIIRVAHHYGFKTINLVRRNNQKTELKELGADEVINIMEENVVQQVKKLTLDKMAHGGLDCIGGSFTKTVMSCIQKGGLVLVYGSLSGQSFQTGLANILFRNVRLHGFYLSNWIDRLAPDPFREFSNTVMMLLADGVMQTRTVDVSPLTLFQQAILRSQETGGAGKVLLIN